MDGFIEFTAILLILAYLAVAIWGICTRKTLSASIGTSAAFLAGGVFIIPIAEAAASILCWIIVVCIVLAIIGAILG